MDEEFGSFVVTDPDLVDEGIDVSGLRTQTDTSLLGNIPDFAGIQYEAFNPNRLSDLMRLYSTGLPMIDTAEVPGAIDTLVAGGGGGGGSSDGGQATIPDIDLGGNTPEDQRLIDEGIGLQIAPGQPVVAPGEMPVTQVEMDEFNYPEITEEMSEVSIPANLDLIDLGNPTGDPKIVPEEMGLVGDIPDRGMGQIPVDTRVTEDFTRPTMADIAGDIDENLIDRGDPTGDPRIVSEEQGLIGSIPDRGRGEIATDEFDVTTDQFTRPTMADIAGPSDFTGAPIKIEDLTTPSNVGDFKITTAPDLSNQTSVLDSPPSIALAKDPEGVEDPFDGKYTMSTAITPEDTEQSITEKIAGFLNVDADKLNKTAVTSALNLVAGKALDTVIPIATVIDLIGSPFTKSPEQEAAEQAAARQNIEENKVLSEVLEEEVTPQDTIDDRGRGEIPTRTEPEPTPTFEQPRGGGADRDDSPAPSASVSTAGQAGPPSQRGGGADMGAVSTPTGISSAFSSYSAAPASVGGGDTGGGGGKDSGSSKIVCTMMNESYGFGSFRNKIWLRHSKGLAPEYQKGYHKIFLPLVRLSKNNKVLKKILEHIAVQRTIDIRQESRGKVHLLGRVYRKILEPICYFVGKHV